MKSSGYEILWRNKSHLFACTVTSLAYSRYAADYNYTEGFAIIYNDREMALCLQKGSVPKRIKRAEVFFSQPANVELYFGECAALEKQYKKFYHTLSDNYQTVSNDELAALFRSLLHMQAKCGSLYQGTNEYATIHLQEKLLMELRKKTEKWQEALAELSVETPREMIEEEMDYAQLGELTDGKILAHVKKHPWLAAKAFTFSDAVTEVKQLFAQRKPRKNLGKSEKYPELLADEKVSQMCGLLKKFSATRITLKNLLGHKLLGSPVYVEIAKRMEVEPAELFYTFDAGEVLNFLENGQKISAGKKRGYVYEDGIEVKIIVENEFETLYSATEEKGNAEISGMVVSPGKASGKVRIVLPDKLIAMHEMEFNEGDILVTTMTNPNMLFLASKAAAIITDEGGITCHAAIISRELKKPCIVGTKNATKVLKNGDKIEVDTNGAINRL